MGNSRLRSEERVNRISAQAIAEKYFGIQATARELPSERDQNFLLDANDGQKFVLKIANVFEAREVLEAQNAALQHVAASVSFCPRILPARSGEKIATIDGHFVRVLSYLPGKPLALVQAPSPMLLRDLGGKLGRLSRALGGFDHQAAHRNFHWDLATGAHVIRDFGPQINTSWLREMVLSYEKNLRLPATNLRRSVIHGDANDYNVLVVGEEVMGLIDFGDMVHSYTAGDLAIAIAYVVLGKEDPYAAAAPVIAGYEAEFPLNGGEREALWPLVRLRLCMSAAIAAHQQAERPENEYLGVSQSLIAQTLPKLLAAD